jgi:hypothetical protein
MSKSSLPLLPRLLIGAALFFGGMYLLMRLYVGSTIDDAIDASPDDITYDSMFLRWNGDFGIVGVKGVHPLPDGSEKSYQADRVVVHTPGLLWLARVGWKGESDELPDDIGFTVENIRLDETDDKTDGNYSNLPFDAVGCGKRKLTPADMTAMGFGQLKRNATMRLTRLDDHSSTFRFAVDTPGVGGSAMEMEIGIERPLEWEAGPQGLITAPIKSASATATDHGFVAARNAYCAKAAGLDEKAFVEHHMRQLDTHLAEEGMTLGVGALERYREFAAKGGELSVVTIGATRLTLGDFMGKERVGKLSGVRTGVRHNGGPLASFEVGTQPKIARVDLAAPATAAAATAPATTPAVATAVALPALPPTVIGAPKAAASPTAPPADTLYNRTRSANLTGTEPNTRGRVVATGDVVPYASLEKHVGERVQITTKMGSVRHGTVLSSNTYQTALKLDAEEGGFNLNVFADTVREVRLIPASALAAANTTN